MLSCAAASTGTSSGRRLRTSPGCGTRPTSSSRNPNDQRNQNLDQNFHLHTTVRVRTSRPLLRTTGDGPKQPTWVSFVRLQPTKAKTKTMSRKLKPLRSAQVSNLALLCKKETPWPPREPRARRPASRVRGDRRAASGVGAGGWARRRRGGRALILLLAQVSVYAWHVLYARHDDGDGECQCVSLQSTSRASG